MQLDLVPATASDRQRIGRIRPPAGMGSFVHYNWFWLDRALADPAIRFRLVRAGPRRGIKGCIAYGPHEVVDLDPASRMAGVGEVYHIVIDRASVRLGLGGQAIAAAIADMQLEMPGLRAVRVSHHALNRAARYLYGRLGFVEIGEKIDGETGIRDRLLELRL
jgi:RimJ/RimL family protein N-acetyltransferase